AGMKIGARRAGVVGGVLGDSSRRHEPQFTLVLATLRVPGSARWSQRSDVNRCGVAWLPAWQRVDGVHLDEASCLPELAGCLVGLVVDRGVESLDFDDSYAFGLELLDHVVEQNRSYPRAPPRRLD